MFETEIIDEYGTANRRIWDALIIITYTEFSLTLIASRLTPPAGRKLLVGLTPSSHLSTYWEWAKRDWRRKGDTLTLNRLRRIGSEGLLKKDILSYCREGISPVTHRNTHRNQHLSLKGIRHLSSDIDSQTKDGRDKGRHWTYWKGFLFSQWHSLHAPLCYAS